MSGLPALWVGPAGEEWARAQTAKGEGFTVLASSMPVGAPGLVYVPIAQLDEAQATLRREREENARVRAQGKEARRLLRRIAKLFDHACADAKKCDCYLAMIDAHFAKFPDATPSPAPTPLPK